MARIGVVVFPGSNCEYDAAAAVASLGDQAEFVWHTRTELDGIDGVILPGGFAHGDYLRPGALARFSPVMTAIEQFAAGGGKVLGICNGFQVLVEAGMLPGALQKNRGLTFLCQPTTLVVTSTSSVLTRGATLGQELIVPINHFSGSYTCDDDTYDELNRRGQIVLRYQENPNGSRDNIAAVANEAGNVVGLMPHPERAMSRLLGSADGKVLMESFLAVTTAPLVLAH
jgi:phosphoribosylformylglycinamidine synthase I